MIKLIYFFIGFYLINLSYSSTDLSEELKNENLTLFLYYLNKTSKNIIK